MPSISPAPPSTNVIDGSEGFFRGLVYRKRTGEIFTIQLNALVMDFALPASLFVATASTPRNEMLAQGPLLEILGAVMLVTYLLWYVFQHQVSKTPKRAIAVQALTVALPNYAAAGLPVVTAILGAKEAVHVAVAIAAGSILPSPLTLLLLELSGGKGRTDGESSAVRVRRALRRAFTKPIVLAPVLGALLSLSGLKIDAVAGASLQLIGVNYRLASPEAGSMVIASNAFSIVRLAVTIAMLYPQ